LMADVLFRFRLGALIFFAISGVLLSCSAKGEVSIDEKREAIHVELFKVVPRTISKKYTVSALLEGSEEAIVASSIAGVVKEFYVREGDHVKRGEKMLLIDPEDYLLETKRARAVAKAKRNSYKREKKLKAKGAVSGAVLEAVQTEMEIADVALSQAELALKRTVVKSPIKGEVVTRDILLGSRVMPGSRLFKVVDTDKVKMNVALSEKEVIHLHTDDELAVEIDAWPGVVFVGKIISVRISPDAETASFPVEIILKSDDKLKPGMVARTSLKGEIFENLILVPAEAIMEKGGEDFIFIFSDGAAKLRKIERGKRFGDFIEVTGGLGAGEEIIPVFGPELVDGSPVEVVKKGSTEDKGKDIPLQGASIMDDPAESVEK